MKNIKDKFFKYYWQQLPEKLHDYIKEPGNVESQSSATYAKELLRFNEYQKYASIKHRKSVNTIILYTGNPNHGKYELWISETNLLKPKFVIFKEMDGTVKFNNLKYKVNNNIALNDIEAQDMVLIPLMELDENVENIVEELCHLLMKDRSIDENFKFKLRKLEVFIINMFVKKEKRRELFEVIKMNIRLDNLEEDLNNWESEVLNRGKLEGMKEGKKEGLKEGKKEGITEIARKLKDKLSIEEISQVTGLDEKTIKKL